MRRAQNLSEDDDGHVIAPMNVEGMPWYSPADTRQSPGGERQELTRSELRHVMFGALGASLLIATALSLGLILFVLFCTEIWLK